MAFFREAIFDYRQKALGDAETIPLLYSQWLYCCGVELGFMFRIFKISVV
jgi:hypothetical protein